MSILREPLVNRFPGLTGIGYDMDRMKIEAPAGSQSIEFELKLSMRSLGHKNRKNTKGDRLQCTNFAPLSCPKNGGKLNIN